ncbi:MaoC/PaaZ C-terminal domain-containing protein [Herbiconiux sp. P16]|uniref:MaoC/PaaZ C-terminal domain-containing protein n=1 Tax=Herbiconiux wuyangfengii TaxID=3342794 RepID=UPI0035B7FD91
MSDATPLYLEDLHVGDSFVTDRVVVEEREIIEFGEKYDPQTFHVDPEAAQLSFFGGLVASGWHTVGMSMRLLVSTVPLAGGFIGAGAQARWPSATRPGDAIHVRATVMSITPPQSKSDRAVVTMECLSLTDDDDVRLELTIRIVVMRRVLPTR